MTWPQVSGGCKVIKRGDSTYTDVAYQYGMSSHADFVSPAAIFQPSGATADADVQAIINWARNSNVAIAVRTGGHQYSAASSTTGKNVQLDLAETYKAFEWNAQTGLLRLGVSHQLIEVSQWCAQNGVFLPHGICAHVNVGGHVHSGGYGMLMRSFGLFSDHVVALDYFTADGQKRLLKKDALANQAEKDLWFSILGGSPGNFGVLTHVTLKPHRDVDHPKSKGLKLIAPYTKERTRAMCELVSEFTKANTVGMDLQVSVFSMTKRILGGLLGAEGVDTFMLHSDRELPSTGAKNNLLIDLVPFPVLQVCMQYGNPGGAAEDDSHVQPWFNRVRAVFGLWVPINVVLGNIAGVWHHPISTMDKEWLFTIVREYDYPFIKTAQNAFDSSLTPKFIDDLCNYIQDIQDNNKNGLMQVMQLGSTGGSNSQTFKNRDNGTAYSWRDGTVNFVYDIFYSTRVNPQALQITMQKQAQAAKTFIGPQGSFCKRDCRQFWGSHGDRNMKNVWQCYLERATYQRVLAAKKYWDPKGVFSPNAFCVGYEGPLEKGTALSGSAAVKAAAMEGPQVAAVARRYGVSHL